MKPALGDVLNNRYTLVYQLRDEPGIQAWRANDRVLARDCQLFLVNDAHSVDDVIWIASSLALSKNKQFTQVLHLQQWGKVALIVTQLDAGISLSDYLRQPVDDSPLDFEAIASIVAGCAEALCQQPNNEFTHRSVSADVIRLTMSGIQIADAPVSPLFIDPSNSPKGSGAKEITTRQLGIVLYEMLTRTPHSQQESRSWSLLPDDTPDQLRMICERAVTFPDHDASTTTPLTSPEELSALLGDTKPLDALDSEQINVLREDAQCSICIVPIRPVRQQDLLDFPSIAANAASTGNASLTGMARQNAEGRTKISTDFTSKPLADLQQSQQSSGNRPTTPTNSSNLDEAHGWHWDFHDIATHMANILSPSEPNTNDLIFPNSSGSNIFDPNSAHNAHFDFTIPIDPKQTKCDGDDAAGGGSDTSGNALLDTSADRNTARIPVFDDSGVPIAPGEESARALQEEQRAIEQGERVTLPPSFIPSATSTAHPETYQSTTTAAPASSDGDDIANTPVFGSIQTKVVAIVIVSIAVVAGLIWALHVLLPDSTAQSTESEQGDWPQINVSEVPFAGQTPPTEDEKSDTTANESGESESTTDESSPTQPEVQHADKVVNAVPSPAIPESNTPLTIDVHQMITKPAGQQGLSYYMHLSEPHTAYRMVVQNRTSGGTAYIRVNTTGDPNAGEQVAQFSFDPSGTTEIKFDRLVQTQDVIIWMPYSTIPNGGVYFSSVQVF